MKINSKTARITFWVLLGIGILASSLALNFPLSATQNTSSNPALQAGTIVATAEAAEDLGSTDGIMLMAVVIVLIVIFPILLRRQVWSNGKRGN